MLKTDQEHEQRPFGCSPLCGFFWRFVVLHLVSRCSSYSPKTKVTVLHSSEEVCFEVAEGSADFLLMVSIPSLQGFSCAMQACTKAVQWAMALSLFEIMPSRGSILHVSGGFGGLHGIFWRIKMTGPWSEYSKVNLLSLLGSSKVVQQVFFGSKGLQKRRGFADEHCLVLIVLSWAVLHAVEAWSRICMRPQPQSLLQALRYGKVGSWKLWMSDITR